ncbi:hypothetical protein COLO4_32224 [Corchorus olitorius]|uniref:Glucose-methanol-choline oxidoreductase C-terminal domain-containing protein n=1 Tax=Corchorus olitorius TaxID=93759 RepID=A0A1R3H094_9ROSI|nr:hypothetical protein COLO4_32224 [Corchorus olitorius]
MVLYRFEAISERRIHNRKNYGSDFNRPFGAPNDNPSVTFNYFKDPQDLQRCVQGIQTILKIVESKPFSKFKYDFMTWPILLNMTASGQINLLPKRYNISSPLDDYCKNTVMTIWHYHGGCQVGRVVSPPLLVKVS